MSKKKKKNRKKNNHCHHILIEIPFISDKEMEKVFTRIADVVHNYDYHKDIDPFMSGNKKSSCSILKIL